jgi:hypothetical protein
MTMETYREVRQRRLEVLSSGWAGNSMARVAVLRSERAGLVFEIGPLKWS